MTWREHVKQSVKKLDCMIIPGVLNLKLYIGFYICVVKPMLMHVAKVRADLGHLQRLAYVSMISLDL
jgi:hypothetical protein